MNKKYFCYIPFEGFTVDPRGKAQLCAAWSTDKDHMIHDLTESATTVENIFYGDHINNIREKMLKDEHVDACNICYKKEAKGLLSKRLLYATSRQHRNLKKDKPFKPELKILDISFSNQCNLYCTMCNSMHSSKWHQQEQALPTNVHHAIKDHYKNFQFKPVILQKEFIDSLLDNINDLELIIIKGGEPLYDKNCLAFLDKISNVKPDLKIKITSNITLITKKTLKMFDKLENLEICASIDGIDKTYEWIRGYKFDQVNENFKLLLNHPKIKLLEVHYTVTPYNVGNILPTINHFSKYQNNKFTENGFQLWPATEPYLSINLLRNDDKKRILEDISENIGNKFACLSLEVQNIKNMLTSTDINQQHGKTFIELTKWMNNQRGFNIQDHTLHLSNMFSLYEK
tara:strand:+ start:587 stop:1789 length:1203 start_codon:yes stop_codon:yes gene_type:complete